VARQLISAAGLPIAAPSANKSGKPSGTQVVDVFAELEGKVDLFIDGGKCEIGLESTVVRVKDGVPVVLRPGKITPQDIEREVGQVQVDKSVFAQMSERETVFSPGMKYKHYAPDCRCVLVEGENEAEQVEKMELTIRQAKQAGAKVIVVMSTAEHAGVYEKYENVQVLVMGSQSDYGEIGGNIFALLRQAESLRPDLIVIEGVSREGLGLALMNRLIRSCAYNVV
jgi:L-threonylcarbamoyladenylate synthase